MSGHPNPEGVKQLHQSLKDFYWTRDRIAELKKAISEHQKALEQREMELLRARDLIEERMREMDVSSPGNHGWEARYFELLLMISQL